MQLAVKNYLASVLARLWAPYCYRLWAAKFDCCSDSDSAFSAAEAAAVASSTAAAAAAAAGGAVDYLYFCAEIRPTCVNLVQDHARECGLSYEASAAGFRYNGFEGYVWFPATRLGGVSKETALRALIKCDFSVRAACCEVGGVALLKIRDGVFHFDDYPLAPVVEESLCRATVVVDGQKLARFELHDKEALEDEVLEELVCKLVRNVRQFREHL